MTADPNVESIIAFVGDSPAQCVTRALAACLCSHPERHHLYAQGLLELVKPNEGEPEWPYVLVIADDGAGFDLSAEGVHAYVAQVEP